MTKLANFAFITPSYAFDLERCALLVESLDRCCPQAHHYIIVDRHDIGKFRYLASERTKIIESEMVVDRGMHRLPMGRGVWVSSSGFTRGWIMQQIRKIAASRVITYETLVFCDSDMAFVRPFDASALLIDGSVGLLDVDFENAETRDWTRIARTLLGLPQGGSVRGHVGQLICWRREAMISMQSRIELVQGVPWQRAIAGLSTFSEYILYGVFVRESIGYAHSYQKPSQVPLVKTSWDSNIATTAGLKSFFEEIDSPNIAVMAHSRDPIDWNAYADLVRAEWRKAGVG